MVNGLYNADYEHDACGVGMVVNIHGNKSHELVDNALKVLENMRHRGAEGADNKTGDGAGIMLQIPHEFILLQGIPVPEKGKYGTAHRQGCRSVTQIEIMPKPPVGPDDPNNPWPNFPRTFKTTSSHEEGCTRRWNINTLEFLGKDGRLTGVRVQEIAWKPNPDGGRPIMEPVGRPEVIKCELVLLAMGFLKPQLPQFAPNVFIAGDAATGASLVVRAMSGGRKAAEEVERFFE